VSKGTRAHTSEGGHRRTFHSKGFGISKRKKGKNSEIRLGEKEENRKRRSHARRGRPGGPLPDVRKHSFRETIGRTAPVPGTTLCTSTEGGVERTTGERREKPGRAVKFEAVLQQPGTPSSGKERVVERVRWRGRGPLCESKRDDRRRHSTPCLVRSETGSPQKGKRLHPGSERVKKLY